MLQGVGVGVIVNLFVGDVSAVLTALPTLLLDQKYSRDFEREADQYAIAMMHANALPLAPMADLFVKMGGTAARDDATTGSDADAPAAPDTRSKKATPRRNASAGFFSSHPSDEERIALLRAADLK
jgi:Zn-dependent protease with chaperone function